jgi:hypothetical protein
MRLFRAQRVDVRNSTNDREHCCRFRDAHLTPEGVLVTEQSSSGQDVQDDDGRSSSRVGPPGSAPEEPQARNLEIVGRDAILQDVDRGCGASTCRAVGALERRRDPSAPNARPTNGRDAPVDTATADTPGTLSIRRCTSSTVD